MCTVTCKILMLGIFHEVLQHCCAVQHRLIYQSEAMVKCYQIILTANLAFVYFQSKYASAIHFFPTAIAEFHTHAKCYEHASLHSTGNL